MDGDLVNTFEAGQDHAPNLPQWTRKALPRVSGRACVVRGGRYWVRTSDLFGVNTTDHIPASLLSGISAGQTGTLSAVQSTSRKIRSVTISHNQHLAPLPTTLTLCSHFTDATCTLGCAMHSWSSLMCLRSGGGQRATRCPRSRAIGISLWLPFDFDLSGHPFLRSSLLKPERNTAGPHGMRAWVILELVRLARTGATSWRKGTAAPQVPG